MLHVWLQADFPLAVFVLHIYLSLSLAGTHTHTPVRDVTEVLFSENIGILYVEGGTGVLEQFISDGLWDEIRIIGSRRILGSGVRAPAVPEGTTGYTAFEAGEDLVKIYFRQSTYNPDNLNIPVA